MVLFRVQMRRICMDFLADNFVHLSPAIKLCLTVVGRHGKHVFVVVPHLNHCAAGIKSGTEFAQFLSVPLAAGIYQESDILIGGR